MAMISFKKGLSTSFATLTKDANTFYYLTDTYALYLGEKLIGDGVSMEMFNALSTRVKTLEDWKNALPEYVTKAVYDEHITAQAAVDKKQTDDIAQLRSDLDDITEVGGEPNKVNDVKVNGTSVVTDKVANLKALANKDTIATADIDNDAVTVDKLADAINTDIAKGVDAHTTVEANKVAWSAKQNALTGNQLAAVNSGVTADKISKYDAFLGDITPDATQGIIDTIVEINSYVDEHTGAFTVLSEKVTKIEDGTTVVAKANADKDGNEFSSTYAKTANLGDLAAKNEADLKLNEYAKTNDISEDIAKGVAAKGVTDTLKSAAFVDTTAFDAAGTAASLIGVSVSVDNGPSGVYEAIQGETTNTVKDCVDAINDINTQLTWGSF